MRPKVGFGLDLSGYIARKTSLAAVVAEGDRATITLLTNSAFGARRTRDFKVDEVVASEFDDLRRCLDIGSVAVDIPIDLQDLPKPKNPQFLWELTRRPVDKKLNAMPPFADRIGAPVARFAAIMKKGHLYSMLGDDLFETYPTDCVRRINGPRNYKSKKPELQKPAIRALCEILRLDEVIESDDDLDAAICAICAVTLTDDLVEDAKLVPTGYKLAAGFRILKQVWWKELRVEKDDFSAWITRQPSKPSASPA